LEWLSDTLQQKEARVEGGGESPTRGRAQMVRAAVEEAGILGSGHKGGGPWR